MRCIVSPSADPVVNLAAEEVFFRNGKEDILFLYSNSPSVIIGKHQVTLAEVNPVMIAENNIKVIRRLSGGGAVYHDSGNLNFSFHKTVADPAKTSFGDFSEPIVKVLKTMGIDATSNARNDIIFDGKKLSGHAQHVFRNRVLSHGTLLINSDLTHLSRALKRESGQFEGKGIPSVRSMVSSLSEITGNTISVESVIQHIVQHIQQENPSARISTLFNEMIAEIEMLARTKYSTWEWNYGYSPPYRFCNSIDTGENTTLACELTVEKGIITEASLTGNYISPGQLKGIENQLAGLRHSPCAIIPFVESVLPENHGVAFKRLLL